MTSKDEMLKRAALWTDGFEKDAAESRKQSSEFIKLIIQQCYVLNWSGIAASPVYISYVSKGNISLDNLWLPLLAFLIGVSLAAGSNILAIKWQLLVEDHPELQCNLYVLKIISEFADIKDANEIAKNERTELKFKEESDSLRERADWIFYLCRLFPVLSMIAFFIGFIVLIFVMK